MVLREVVCSKCDDVKVMLHYNLVRRGHTYIITLKVNAPKVVCNTNSRVTPTNIIVKSV